MSDVPIAISVLSGHPDATAEELSQAAIDTRSSLLELPVSKVDFVRDRESPPGAKAASAVELGQLIVVATPTSALLGAIVALLRAKIRAGSLREISLTSKGESLHLKGIPEDEQEALVSSWVKRIAEDEANGEP